MNNLFQYTKTEGQGWLVEKPEMEKPDENNFYEYNPEPNVGVIGFDIDNFKKACAKYENHLATLRRFKYDYPDPGKEMVLDKDFEVVFDSCCKGSRCDCPSVKGFNCSDANFVAIPINPFRQDHWAGSPETNPAKRTYSEQEALIERKDLFDKYVELEEKITTKILDIGDSELMDMWLDWQEKRNILNTDWLKTLESLSIK